MRQAIGVIPAENGGVTLLVKKADKHHQPAASTQTTTFSASKGSRKYVEDTDHPHQGYEKELD